MNAFRSALPLALVAGIAGAAHAAGAPGVAALEALDTAAIQEKISDANLSKSLDKVAFSGIIYNRLMHHQYLEFPENLGSEAQGNSMDANFTLKLAINASPLIKVWSMLSFGYDFGGHFLNSKAYNHPTQVDVDGSVFIDSVRGDAARMPYVQDKNREGGRVFEDLMAGADIRTEPMDANLRAGGTLWAQGSPLTIWKRNPRPHFAWYYESYEPEQSSAQYYTQKFFYRRNDLGRASWPKKAFGGMELDAYRLPGGFALQLDIMQPSNMLPTKTDGNTNSHLGDAEALESINSIGQLFYGRASRNRFYRDLSGGLNLLWVEIPTDIINQKVFNPNALQGYKYQFTKAGRDPFYVNPRVLSFDTRGNVAPGIFMQSDIAVAIQDTVQYGQVPGAPAGTWDGRSPIVRKRSDPSAAAYLKLNKSGALPMEGELFYAAKDFWSPYAITEYAVPVNRDEMKLGTGSFSYQANLLGANWKVSPKVSSGFLSFTLGQHLQAEKGLDVVRFQHTLNGREAWYSTSSWSRTEPGRYLDEGRPYGNPRYESRLGDIRPSSDVLHLKSQIGGLHGDDLEVWEEFAAFESADQANTGAVPENRKFAFTAAMDWGYNVGSLIGYERPFMTALYTTVNTISTKLTGPLKNGNTLLWSAMARFEPAISLSNSFQVIGLVGAETWKSDKAYRNKLANKQGFNPDLPGYEFRANPDGSPRQYDNVRYYEPISSYAGAALPEPYVEAELSPVDYLQLSYGIGFDWDFTQRAGLHVRAKYATHADKNIPTNDWQGAFLFGETKIWF